MGINDQQLQVWISEKYLDQATERALREVLTIRLEIAGHEARLQQLERERTGIHNEQKRIRDNLQALGDRSAEKELRERFVRTLSSQEDRLEKIQQETEAVNRKREASLEKIQAALGKLEYEVSLK